MKYRTVGFIASFTLCALYTILSRPVYAHAFGVQYNLPIPVQLYLYGGAGTIILSFLAAGVFLNESHVRLSFPQKNVSQLLKFLNPLGRFFKLLTLFFFLFAIATGIWGTDQPVFNFNMTFFWIIFYLGFTYLIAVFGNFWPFVNPWKTLVEAFEKIEEGAFKGKFPYPKSLGYYPAILFYFLLIFSELIDKTTPQSLSFKLASYTLLSIVFAYLFGKKVWLEKIEFFSVFFKLFSKISILEKKGKSLFLRLPFIGLLEEEQKDFSLILFVLFMLSSTFFDGFRSTTLWYHFEIARLASIEQALGTLGNPIIQTIAMLSFLAAFLALYFLVNSLMKVLIRSSKPASDFALLFIFSLIPIALVYNAAHYYTLLLVQGQSIIYLLSDPFGLGWNLLGTASFAPNVGIIGARFVWNSQVALILLGHIAAIVIAHLISLKTFPTHKKALLSQLPMLILMVFYTMAGLWILSQPLTGGA